jgi:hypothetical protein
VHTEMEPAIPWAATHRRGLHKRQHVFKALFRYRAEFPTTLRLGRGKTSQPQAISHMAQECRARCSSCLGFLNKGFLVVVGGSTSDAVEWTATGTNYISFQQTSVFVPATGQWHNQTASGTIPNPHPIFCLVGARGDNGTYEIFIFDGHVASPGFEPQSSSIDAEKQRNIDLD